MRVLVTGASGFVGEYLVQHLLDAGDEVLGTTMPGLPYKEVSGCSYKSCDVTNADEITKIISDYKPDAVYHLAAIAFVPEAEKDFSKTLVINVGGVSNVAKASSEIGAKLLFISSSDIYGKIDSLPITEETPLRPANNYSLSKLMGELVVERYERTSGLRAVIARPFNHIGPRQNDRFVVANFAMQLAKISLGREPAVMKVGNLSAKRDFSDVRDIVKAYRAAIVSGKGIYNFCSGKAVSIQAILDELIEISGLEVRIEHDPARMRPSDTPEHYGSYEKAKRELGWSPSYSLRQSLEDIYQYSLGQVK